MSEFETFALDHKRHPHCVACGGCLLRQDLVELPGPFWCSGCAVRLCKKVPVGVSLPFEGGTMFTQEVVDAFCARELARLGHAD